MTKTILIIAITTILIGTSFTSSSQTANAAFPVIDFETPAMFPTGTSIDTQFHAQGAHFSSTNGAPAEIYTSLANPPEGSSVPNILVGVGPGNLFVHPIWIDIVDAAGDPAVTESVDVHAISVGGMTLTVTAKDANGGVIFDEDVGPNFPGMGKCNGIRNDDLVSISGVGPIASVHFEVTNVTCPDGYGIDDVIIGDLIVPDESTEVDIDIKPGSFPSSVNCKNLKGNVPLAIFGNENFDVIDIEIVSMNLVGLEPIEVFEVHDKLHIDDLNDDGFDDAVLHLDKAEVCEATDGAPLKETVEVEVTGSTADGDFEGTGDIRIVKR